MANPVETMCDLINKRMPNDWNGQNSFPLSSPIPEPEIDLDGCFKKTFRNYECPTDFKVGDIVIYSYYWNSSGFKSTCLVASIGNDGWIRDGKNDCFSTSFHITSAVIWEVHKQRGKK